MVVNTPIINKPHIDNTNFINSAERGNVLPLASTVPVCDLLKIRPRHCFNQSQNDSGAKYCLLIIQASCFSEQGSKGSFVLQD